jgi:uncharacterized protein (TIGR02145 family)
MKKIMCSLFSLKSLIFVAASLCAVGKMDAQVTDVVGNVYNTVTIGSQVWMAENLKTTKYNDGTDIPLVTDGTAWAALSTPGYCWYNNDAVTNKNTYGALYNWYAVNTAKLCPTGWHVPSNEEWTVLTTHLGGESVAGGKLKETGTSHWLSPNTGATNETGFTALPGGYRDHNYNAFKYIGEYSFWWSSTLFGSDIVLRGLGSASADMFLSTGPGSRYGSSIRCLQDSPAALPAISTTAVSTITQTTATTGGNITADGGAAVTARGVCWSTTTNPTIALTTKTTDGSATGAFTSSITGLTAGTTYYVRAYATNSSGTAYGMEVSFTTGQLAAGTASDYYLPLGVGNYTQLHTTVIPPGSNWGARTTYYSILRSESINGVPFFVEQGKEVMDNNPSDIHFFRCGWLRTENNGNIVAGAFDPSGTGNLGSATLINPPYFQMFPNEFLTVGYSRTLPYGAGVSQTDSVISVTATAGTYTNCIQLRSTRKTNGIVDMVENYFYAYQIGLVMSNRTLPADQAHTNYLVQYVINNPTVSKTINTSAGGLATALTPTELGTTTNLKITGTIDARDFKTMRDNMPLLATVDLSGSTVAAYTGTEGTYNTTSIVYPANTIPQRSFYYTATKTGKISLKSFVFPTSVSTIDLYAFRGSGLSAITIPSPVTLIGYGAFYGSGLASIEIPTSVTKIDKYAFAYCSSLKTINIPASVTSIGAAAFLRSGLTSIAIPNGVASIGEYAFQNCDFLTTVSIPASVNYIGYCAITFDNALTSIQVASDNAFFSSSDGVLFDKTHKKLLSFPGAKSADYLIPSGVTVIDTAAFEGSNVIRNVTIPSSVTTLSPEAFYYCTNLINITIPASVTAIGGYAFYNCYGLNTIQVNSATPVNLAASDSVFKYVDKNVCTLFVPVGSKAAYQAAYQWNDFSNILELPQGPIDLQNGLVAYYPFNGNANDESGNAYHGTVYGSTLTTNRNGKANSAYNFNGISNYISIDGVINSLYQSSQYSVTGWFKTNNASQKGSIFAINREKEIVWGQNTSLIVWDSNNLNYYNDSLQNSNYYYPAIDASKWHFFALVLDKNNLGKLYIDNNIICQDFVNTMKISQFGKASIGQEWDNGSNGSNFFSVTSDHFNGLIDDIRLYNRVLNTNEIHSLFNESSPDITYSVTVPTGTKACYIAGEMNGWTQQAMTKVDATHYTITGPSNVLYHYKYYSGPDLKFEEKKADGSSIAPRTYSANDVVEKWTETFNPATLTASDYYLPLGVGNYTQLHTPGGSNWGARTTYYRILRSENINGVPYFVEQGKEIMDENPTNIHLFRCLWIQKDTNGNIVAGAFDNGSGNLASATKLNPPIYLFPNEFLTVGYSRSIQSETDSVISVTATAGTYTNCIQIRNIKKTNGVITRVEDSYYAYHIGLVRQNMTFPVQDAKTDYFVQYVVNDPAVSKTVNITAGGLAASMTQLELNTLMNLKITGTIDARDFKTMRDNMPFLAQLDLSEVNVIAYVGPDGPSIWSDNYPANAVPESAFMNASLNPWLGKNSLTSVILPASLTSIGQNAFYGCNGLTSMTIPNLVTTIGDDSFSFCHGLNDINIPSSVTLIGDRAFMNCTALINIDTGNPNYSSLEGVLFNKTKTTLIQCPISKTGTYNIPTSVTSIGAYSFYFCNGLATLYIPISVTTIGSSAFDRCSGLFSVDAGNPNFSSENGILFNKTKTFLILSPFTKTGDYTIPSSVNTIGSYAFSFCGGYTSITIPSSVTSIGTNAFADCTGLTSITAIGSYPIKLGSSPNVFYNVNKNNCTLNVPYGAKVLYAASNQWQEFTNITEASAGFTVDKPIVILANTEGSSATVGITANVAWSATKDQPWLTVSPASGTNNQLLSFTATANSSVLTRIATVTVSAANYASQMVVVYQYGAIKTINLTAGSLATSLTADELNAISRLTLTGTIDARDFKTMRDNMPLLAFLDISGANVVAYTGTEGTAVTGSIAYPANGIPDNAFYNGITSQGKGSLISAILPNSVTSIGISAFRSCNGLTSMVLPSSTLSIGNTAFLSCAGLTSITIPPSVTSLGVQAISRCINLTSVNISAFVTSIGNNAFLGSGASISVNENNPNYSGLDGVLFDKTKSSLISCPVSKTGSYVIPSSVSTITPYAFYNCGNLTSVTIPSSVNAIGNYAFQMCSGLTSIYTFAGTPIDLSANTGVFASVNKSSCVLHVPAGTKAAYQAANQWKDFVNIVESQNANAVVKKTTTAPVVDGVIDAVWDNANTYNIVVPQGTPTLGLPGTTTWKSLWTNDGIYILLQVNDDVFYPAYAATPPGNDWMYDRAEIYFDVNQVLKDANGPVNSNGHYQFAPGFVESQINKGAFTGWDGTTYAFTVTNPTYVAEYFIPFNKLLDKNGVVVSKTAAMGFDVIILDRDNEATARQNAAWSSDGSNGGAWNNMDGCGTIILEGADAGILVTGITVNSAGNATTIETNAGTLQMSASILPVNATNPSVQWSVTNGTGKATIDGNGLLSAYSNGTVTVNAESMDGSNITASKLITISNQPITPPDAATMVFSVIGNAFYGSDGVTPASWNYDIDMTFVGTTDNVSSYRINNLELLTNGEFKIRKSHQWNESYGYSEVTVTGDPTNFAEIGPDKNIKVLSGNKYEITFLVNWANNARTLALNALIPIVTTASASSITSTSATSGGEIVNPGSSPVTARGVCWSTTADPTVALSTKTTNGSGNGAFESYITGLTAATTYHIRAYATTAISTYYGPDVTFTTQTALPVANAGADQSVDEGVVVTLDGSASTAQAGSTLTYKWTAPAGITLSSTTASKPTFTAPNVTANTDYTFSLVVNDGTADSPADQVVISVKNVPVITHFTPVWTGNGFDQMNINIYSAKMDGLEMEAGDEVGIFDGTICVGVGKLTGAITQQSTLDIVVSKNDGSGNGYTAGNTISFKLYDASKTLEMSNVTPLYASDDPSWSTDGKFAVSLTSFVALTGVTKVSQDIALNLGWNIISAYVVPANPDLKAIFQTLIDAGKLKKVMDEAGKTIENFGAFGGWKNNIGNINPTKGYKVNVTATSTLSMEGQPVTLPINIPLALGWNIISYPCPTAQDAKVLVQPLIDSGQLKKVMDEAGKTIENFGAFGGWKNNIGNFLPGKGYKVNVTAACTLSVAAPLNKSAVIVPDVLASAHFSKVFTGNGTDHFNVHLVELASSGLQAGDQIGIFDGNYCVGSATIGQDQLLTGSISIPASFNDEVTGKVNGFTVGHPVTLQLYRENQTYPLTPAKVGGSDAFEKNGSLFLRVTASDLPAAKISVGADQVKCYPNPFADQLTIEIRLTEPKKLEVSIYDLNGKLVRSLFKGDAGTSETLIWDGTNGNGAKMGSGTYILKANGMIEKVALKK